MNEQFIGVTIAAEYTDGYTIKATTNTRIISISTSAYEKQTFRRSLEPTIMLSAGDVNPCLNLFSKIMALTTNPYRQGLTFFFT